MFIPYLRVTCLTFVISFFATATFADIYKWIDENGETHYTQQAPQGISSTSIKTPPPPTLDPKIAQQQVDELIQQQESDDELRLEAKKQIKVEAENKINQEKNCSIAQQKLQQYQDNPGRRISDEQGNVTRLTEEERQQKIQESQDNVNTYCQ